MGQATSSMDVTQAAAAAAAAVQAASPALVTTVIPMETRAAAQEKVLFHPAEAPQRSTPLMPIITAPLEKRLSPEWFIFPGNAISCLNCLELIVHAIS